MKHLPGEQQLAIFVLVADGVGDQSTVQRQGQPGGKIAHLVGVGKEHQLRLLAQDKLLQGVDVSVRSIGLERRPFQVVYLFDLVARQFLSQGRGVVARQNHFDGPAGFFANRLSSGQGFQRNPVQLTFPLLRDHQDPICHDAGELRGAAAQVRSGNPGDSRNPAR